VRRTGKNEKRHARNRRRNEARHCTLAPPAPPVTPLLLRVRPPTLPAAALPHLPLELPPLPLALSMVNTLAEHPTLDTLLPQVPGDPPHHLCNFFLLAAAWVGPGGAPFSQLSSGVRDAMVVSTKLVKCHFVTKTCIKAI